MESNLSKELLCCEGISCLSWNHDNTMCVLSKRDNNLYIYDVKNKMDPQTWTIKYTLISHLLYISAVDWHPVTQKIISASHDRSIFIWTFESSSNQWINDVVNLNQNRAILDVKWSFRGDKFSCCTGSNLAGVGYFQPESNWWEVKTIKSHKSSVNSAKLDKSGLFMISGGCDMKLLITSAYIPEVDDTITHDDNVPFPIKKKFGEILYKVNTKAWVNDVVFSPNGKYSFAGSHNSTLSIIKSEGTELQIINLPHSPISKIIPINDETIIVIGYDRHFYKYSCSNVMKKWSFVNSITKVELNQPTETEEKKDETVSFKDKLGVFKNVSKKVSLIVTTNKNGSKNIHSANISAFNLISNNLVTADLAGYIKLWPF